MDVTILGSIAAPRHWGRVGANIPMAKWLSGLTAGLSACGCHPLLVGHLYEASWPRGRLFADPNTDLDPKYITSPIRFSNLPFIRSKELIHRYRLAIHRYNKQKVVSGKLLITYNPYPWHLSAAHLWQSLGGKWINIVLDYSESDLGLNWSSFLNQCGKANGQVFLSWWAYQNFPGSNKLHLDSGVSELNFSTAGDSGMLKSTKYALYAGKLSADGGMQLMAETFLQTPGADLEFRVVGQGKSEVIEAAARKDHRIKVIGFVDEQKLKSELLNADVFINPRDPSNALNKMIFPSKLLHYLSYGKPVVSTWTDGLAPEYKKHLDLVPKANSQAFSQVLRTVLDRPSSCSKERLDALRSFLVHDRNWNKQASRLLEFMNNL